jgi:RNA polymerase-interacting CarD/CdnL/TRCF family regulator
VLGCSIETAFKQGDHVVYRPHGVAKIVGTVQKGAPNDTCECFALDLPSGVRAFIPTDKAGSMLRPLVTRAEATHDLEVLREDGIKPEPGFHKARQERDRIIKSGTRDEIVALLRRLYAKKAPASDAEARVIRAIEDVVLSEIAIVLEVERGVLEAEMRQRYPVIRTAQKR